MHCMFAFTHTAAGQFQISSELVGSDETTLLTLADEDEFIQAVVLSLSDNEIIMQLISHVLLASAGRCSADHVTLVEISEAELHALGLLEQRSPPVYSVHHAAGAPR